jgi:hypothetical protein
MASAGPRGYFRPSSDRMKSRHGADQPHSERISIMIDNSESSRRHFLILSAAAIAAIPILGVRGNAYAATNASMRASLKYQDSPNGDKACSNCMHFVPGKTPSALGGCKIMPGDSEISPHGSCVGWAAIPKK